jgi:hypothetical protein
MDKRPDFILLEDKSRMLRCCVYLAPIVPFGVWLALWGVRRFEHLDSPLPSALMLFLGSAVSGLALAFLIA